MLFSRRTTALFLLCVTIPFGIVWRHLPLPYLAWKYGGSCLWTVALYCFLVVLMPHARAAIIAIFAAVISVLVECSRLINFSLLNTFRATLAGKLVLGRFFAFKDIAAYECTVLALFLLDRCLAHTPQSKPHR